MGRAKVINSIRHTVLVTVDLAPEPLTGQQVAKRCGITYKQSIDALNALNNLGRIARVGRKFTARWVSLRSINKSNPAHPLEQAFRRFFA